MQALPPFQREQILHVVFAKAFGSERFDHAMAFGDTLAEFIAQRHFTAGVVVFLCEGRSGAVLGHKHVLAAGSPAFVEYFHKQNKVSPRAVSVNLCSELF